MASVNMAAGILLLEDIDNVDAAIGVKAEAAKNVKNVTQHVESVESGVLSATARQPGLLKPPQAEAVPLGAGLRYALRGRALATRVVMGG